MIDNTLIQKINVEEMIRQVSTTGKSIVGYGLDIVDINDFHTLLILSKSNYLQHYYTDVELQLIGNNIHQSEKLAGRFALKEAVMKALGVGWGDGIAFTDVEVLTRRTGEPYIRLKRKLARLERSKNIEKWFVTISHSNLVAIAGAIAVGK